MNALSEQEIRYRLLKILSQERDHSQRRMAREMGISLGKVNYCVSALIKQGLLKVHRFQASRNKVRYIYLLTPSGIEEKARLTVDFLKTKLREHEEIKRQIRELLLEMDQENLPDGFEEADFELMKGAS
jgi:EPS-associated MarR family transcriptional regulator